MSKRLRLVPLVLALGLGVSACTSDGNSPSDKAPPVGGVPVAISDSTPDVPVKVGVLVTLRSQQGLGDALVPAAAGAQVAQTRLTLGGGEVALEVADDRGTAAGARDAVRKLLDQDVAGIVVASAGDHLDDALQEASDSGTAVIAPYVRDSAADLPGVWLTGPDASTVNDRIRSALEDDGLERPFVVTGDGVDVTIDAVASADIGSAEPGALARQVARQVREGRADAVVIGASAARQAPLVAALQGRETDIPVILTPEALSGEFAETLLESGGTTAGELVTVGTDATDATSLGQGTQADAAAAFFAALRLRAGDSEATDLFGSTAFAEVAHGADIASHDAVVAIVAAAAEAGSVEPTAVRDALSGLELSSAQGLAGPPLDFTSASALDAQAVVLLHSTAQDPGVRPASAEVPFLRWFAVPDSED